MEAKLVVIGGKANMGEVKLRLPMTIGRGNKADLMISHPTVSREHCRLFEKNGELVVQDNGSSNGTFVDGEKIEAAVVVQPGQILAIGPLTFRAEYEAPTSNVSSATKSGPLADTQAIDSDELDLDFLLGDDAPAKPAPAKPKAEKKVEAKAPAVAPGKSAKNAPPEAKDKKSGGTAPTIQEPTKSTKTTADAEQAPKAAPPAKGVKETAELDVDFLLDDLAEEQKQAPAAKDTSEIDLSDLGLDEPVAKSPAAPPREAKSPNVAPPAAKTPAPVPKADDFEQTIDFSGIGDDDEKPSAPAPMEDLLPSDDVKPGDIDFDFLSDLDDAKPAVAAKIEEPVKQVDSPKIVPPQPEPLATTPVKEPPVASEPAAPEPDFNFDDFLGDIEAAPTEQATAVPTEAASFAPVELPEVAPPAPEGAKPEFDFSALSETQDVAIGPPSSASVEEPAIEVNAPEAETPTAEPRAKTPVEDSSSATIPDFDFLAKEEVAAVVDIAPVADVTPIIDATPIVDSTEPTKAGDFSFLDDLEAKPAESAELPSPALVENAAERAPDFSAFAEPAAEPRSEEPAFEATLNFDAIQLDVPAADVAEMPVMETPVVEAEKPAAEFDFDAFVVDEVEVKVEPSVAAPAAEDAAFDFLADVPKAVATPSPEAKKPADEFDFLGGDDVAVPPASAGPPEEGVAETVMISAAETPVADVPSASAEPSAEFSFDQPKESAAEVDFGSFEAVEAKVESEPAADFGMFAAPTSEPEAAADVAPAAEAESSPVTFAPAAKTAPSSPVAKKPAAQGPSFLEKIKLLFGGSKKAPAKKAGAKKSDPVAPVSTTKYQPVIANPVKPVDAPIPLDDSPIPLDDLTPTDAPATDSAATEMFVGLASLETAAVETPSVGETPGIVAADAVAADAPLESSPSEAAASIAPPVDVDATAMFDAFAAVGPVAEKSDAPTNQSADDAFGDFLSDLGASDAPAAAAEAPAAAPWGETAETKPAAEAAAFDFNVDDLAPTAEPEEVAADEWSLETPAVESPPAADQLELDFLSEELAESSAEAAAPAPEQSALEPVAETTQEPTAEAADRVADADVPAADAAEVEAIAAETPAAELATPSAPRRPAHIDVDLRMSSSLRPLARVHLQRPRHDLPEMEPEEPAGRNFTPRAKMPPAPGLMPEAAADSAAPTPFDSFEALQDSEAPAFAGFDLGSDSASPPAEAEGAPVASLGDADFDFLAKEQEAEAALELSGAAPTSETPLDPTADLFAGLEAATSPAPVEEEEEFIISLDELSEEPTATEVPPSAEVAAEAAPATDVLGEVGVAKETAAAPDAGFELDFLDLEISDESPASVDRLEVIDVVEEAPAALNEEEKSAAQPVAAKKAPAQEDEELADFLRDLGMN